MTLLFYRWVMWLLQPLFWLKLQYRARQEAGYGDAVAERFGHYSAKAAPCLAPQTQPDQRLDERGPPSSSSSPSSPSSASSAYVWVHAVSLGETRAAAVLLEALRAAHPQLRILLTHGTATGRAQGASLLREGDVQVWQPWDNAASVQRFLSHFKPRLGLILETELWPNWVAQCRQASIPLVLLNARMSAKSLRQSQRLAWLSRPAYQGLSAVLAQTEDDAHRLQSLGANVLAVTGNLKFDATPDAAQLAQAAAWRAQLARPVVLLASAREGEEALWLDALQALDPAQRDAVQWLLVPRHPQRFDEVAGLITQRGWGLSRRSQWGQTALPSEVSAPTLWLGDSLGEMALYYGLAQCALLGGSFAPLGGQNLIEAAACGCPVIMGPHTFNFAEAAELALAAGAALRVSDMTQAVQVAMQQVQTSPDAQPLLQAQACLAFAQAHRGATQRTVQALGSYLAN